jgi:hypothetical protein
MRRTAILALSVLFLSVIVAEAVVAEDEGSYVRPADPSAHRYLPRRAATEFCSQEARDALREAGLGVRAPEGYEAEVGYVSDRQCELFCDPCAYESQEEWCYDNYVDSYNGGCNSSPYAFDILTPAFGTIGVCGTCGTYLYNTFNYRDTDWYEITVPEQIHVTWRCIAEFPLAMFLVDADAGCGNITIIDYQYVDECTEGVFELNLEPGNTWLFVAPSVYSGVPCGSDYTMSFEWLFETPDCVTSCPPGAVLEGEPLCGPEYQDHYNGGCNTVPYVFGELEPKDGQIVLCGEGGVFPYSGVCYRDTDWYEMVLDEPRDVQFCIVAGFDYQVGIIDATPGCAGMGGFMHILQGPPCDVACDTWSLDPGVYWLWVGSWNWRPVDCGRGYAVTIDGFTTPVEDQTWGSLKAIYR